MTEKQRLFFAFWPDDQIRRQIAEVLDVLPSRLGKRVPVANLHITLNFLGNITAPLRECVEAAADKFRAQAFELKLDQLGMWPRSGIVWLGASVVPPALSQFAAEMNCGIEACGIATDTRPYRPHVTLLRHATARSQRFPEVAPFIWPVDHFVLVESTLQSPGSCYRILRHWPLVAGV